MNRPRVYLAGPDIFAADALARGADLKRMARSFNLEPLWPLDIEIDHDPDRCRMAGAIEQSQFKLIDSAQGIVANLSPVRGPNMDPGTAAVIGYARAKQIPIFAWSCDRRSLIERTLQWISVSKRAHRLDGHPTRQIEDFGLVENLMVAIPAGRVFRSVPEAFLAAANELTAAARVAS